MKLERYQDKIREKIIMKYLVQWTEFHSAVVEADSEYDAGFNVFGRFDADDTFDGTDEDSRHITSEDEKNGESFNDVTVPSLGGATRSHAHALYEACREFVRKVECGEARSKRSYKQMKQALNFIHNLTESEGVFS